MQEIISTGSFPRRTGDRTGSQVSAIEELHLQPSHLYAIHRSDIDRDHRPPCKDIAPAYRTEVMLDDLPVELVRGHRLE